MLVLAGKNKEQNEVLVRDAKPEQVLCHTKEAGSPFCLIEKPLNKLTKAEMQAIAKFCALFSKAFKQGKKLIEVHFFEKKQVFKLKSDPVGTFHLKGKVKSIKVKPVLQFGIKNGFLVLSEKPDLSIARIEPGKLDKEKAIAKLETLLEKKLSKFKLKMQFSKEDIAKTIPARNLSIKSV